MKQIVALIRQQRFNRTRTALADAGFSSFTARKVVGRGQSDRGEGSMLLPRRMLTVVVKDNDADAVIRTIIGVNKTGVAGDGRIFVLPVHDASRIRTREHGTEALTER